MDFDEAVAAEELTEEVADYGLEFENGLVRRCLNQLSGSVKDMEELTCS